MTVTTESTAPASTAPVSLVGTPVVPGLAYGPALLARTEVSASAVEAYAGRAGDLGEEEALTAYEEAAAAVAAGFTARAEKTSGHTAEVMTASAGLATDRGLRNAVRKNLRSGEALPAALAAAVEQFVGLFTQAGGLMA